MIAFNSEVSLIRVYLETLGVAMVVIILHKVWKTFLSSSSNSCSIPFSDVLNRKSKKATVNHRCWLIYISSHHVDSDKKNINYDVQVM